MRYFCKVALWPFGETAVLQKWLVCHFWWGGLIATSEPSPTTWASQTSSETDGQVESPSEVWWLRFSATPPLRRCPLCLCVLAGGLSEDPSHPGNWWACDVIPPSPRLTTSPPCFGASHQSVLREIRSRESPPLPVLVTIATSAGPGSILLWWGEGEKAGGEGGKRQGRTGGREVKEEQIPGRRRNTSQIFSKTRPVFLLHCKSPHHALLLASPQLNEWMCNAANCHLQRYGASDTFEPYCDVIVCNSFVMSVVCAAGLTLGRHWASLCLHASLSFYQSPVNGWWQTQANRGVVGTSVLGAITDGVITWQNALWCIVIHWRATQFLSPALFFNKRHPACVCVCVI